MYPKKPKNWTKHLDFMIIDVICLLIALLQAYILRFGFVHPNSLELFGKTYVIFAFVDLFIALCIDSFKEVLKRGYYKEFVETIKHVTLVILSGVFLLFIIKEANNYSRMNIAIASMIYLFLSYITRIIWKSIIRLQKKYNKNLQKMIIITTKNQVFSVINEIEENDYHMKKMVGICIVDGEMDQTRIHEIPIIKDEDELLETVCRGWVDEIFINLPENTQIPHHLLDAFEAMGVTVHIKIANVINVIGQKQTVEQIGQYTVLTTSVNMVSMKELFLKRLVDICGGIIGCLVTGVLFLFVAPCIKILSPGPVFFSQVRVGKNGKRFKIYKFRSMCIDAEEKKKDLMKENLMQSDHISKFQNDCRIIGSEKGENKGFGNFIRKYSIDEFPQFYNVLRGDMSLVGTRPPTVDEWEKYDLHHRARLAVKPGITGMWQVNGRNNITDFEKIVNYDKSYIENWSIGLDCKILLRTVKVVLVKEGSM